MRFKLALCAAAAACTLGAAHPLQAQRGRVTLERARIDTTVTFDRSGTIELELASGEIRVNAWTRNEVQIVATSERGTVSAALSPSRIELDTRGAAQGTTRYSLTVPIGVAVAASTASGRIIVNGTRGDLQLETRSGSIEASEASGRVDVEAISGRVTLQRLSGTVSVAVISGTVTISEIDGDLEIETTSGRAQVERADVRRLSFESVSGSLDFAGTLGATGPHSVDTHSGNVTLRVPANFAATIDLETFRGELRPVDFPLIALPGGGRGRDSGRRRFSINGGGAPLSISTFSGDIVIRRLGATPQER
jgi:DUF4097 and DUF4098 domain-containing protein YvlB